MPTSVEMSDIPSTTGALLETVTWMTSTSARESDDTTARDTVYTPSSR